MEAHPHLLVWDPPAATVRRLTTFPEGDQDLASLALSSYAAQGGQCIAIATGGDLDGDSSRDFVVTVDDQTFVMTDLAADTPLANAHATLALPVDDLAIGDFNSDGQADLAVAGDATAHIFYGPLAPGQLSEADAAHTWITALNTDNYNAYYNDTLYAADADLDEHTDLLIGVPGDDGRGRLWLAFGPLL